MITLYEYSIKQQQAMQQARDVDGDLTDELIDLFDSLDLDRQHIIDYHNRKARNLLSNISMIDNELKRMNARKSEIKKYFENTIDKLNEFMQPEINSGLTKFDSPIGDIKFTLKGGAVKLMDDIKPEDLPVEFQNTTITADLTSIGKQLDSREDLKELCYRTDKYRSVSIK